MLALAVLADDAKADVALAAVGLPAVQPAALVVTQLTEAKARLTSTQDLDLADRRGASGIEDEDIGPPHWRDHLCVTARADDSIPARYGPQSEPLPEKLGELGVDVALVHCTPCTVVDVRSFCTSSIA